MNTDALVLMIFSIAFLWGGLSLAIIHLMRNPDPTDDDINE